MTKNIMQRSNRYIRARMALVDGLATLAKGAVLLVLVLLVLAVVGTGFVVGSLYILFMAGVVLAAAVLIGLAVFFS